MTKYFPDICWGTRLYEAGFLPTLAQHLAAESIINSYTSTVSVREEQLMGHSQVAGKALGIHSPFCLQWMEPCGERSLKHRLLPASSESPCFCAYGGQLPPEWTTLIDCRAVVSHWTRTTVQPSINHYCQAACTVPSALRATKTTVPWIPTSSFSKSSCPEEEDDSLWNLASLETQKKQK